MEAWTPRSAALGTLVKSCVSQKLDWGPAQQTGHANMFVYYQASCGDVYEYLLARFYCGSGSGRPAEN